MTITTYNYPEAVDFLTEKITKDETTLIAGNGGFAAEADHFSGELIPLGYPVIAMSSLAAITAISNDFGYEHTIIKYIRAFKPKNLILLTTSGSSPNITGALEWLAVQNLKINILLISGKEPNLLKPAAGALELKKYTHLKIFIPQVSPDDLKDPTEITARLQEETLQFLHDVYRLLKNR